MASNFNFGGRQIERLPIHDVEPPWEGFDPQVAAFLIVRAIRMDESNLAQELLQSQDTGLTSTPRLWEFQICGNCSTVLWHLSVTFLVGCCDQCDVVHNIANSFRQQQNFMHLSSKLTDSFASHIHYALETTLNKC